MPAVLSMRTSLPDKTRCGARGIGPWSGAIAQMFLWSLLRRAARTVSGSNTFVENVAKLCAPPKTIPITVQTSLYIIILTVFDCPDGVQSLAKSESRTARLHLMPAHRTPRDVRGRRNQNTWHGLRTSSRHVARPAQATAPAGMRTACRPPVCARCSAREAWRLASGAQPPQERVRCRGLSAVFVLVRTRPRRAFTCYSLGGCGAVVRQHKRRTGTVTGVRFVSSMALCGGATQAAGDPGWRRDTQQRPHCGRRAPGGRHQTLPAAVPFKTRPIP